MMGFCNHSVDKHPLIKKNTKKMGMPGGQWAVGSGQWAVGSGQGQWAVGSGQWKVDSGKWTTIGSTNI